MIDDDLPRVLADLFAAERTAPVSDLVRTSALRAKLAATVGSAPLGTAAAAGGIGKALATIALVVAAGGGAVAVHHATPPHLVWTVAAAHAPVVVTSEIAAPAVVVDPPATPPPPPVARAFPRKRPVPSPPAEPAAHLEPAPEPLPLEPTEIALLRDAWRALSAGDAHTALDLTHRDATLHPDGALAEERDALAIEAQARLDLDQARLAARTFFEHHPTSVHRARIERALQETP